MCDICVNRLVVGSDICVNRYDEILVTHQDARGLCESWGEIFVNHQLPGVPSVCAWAAFGRWMLQSHRSVWRPSCCVPTHRSSGTQTNPLNRTWTRVAREAGARVAHKQLLRDTNVQLSGLNDRWQLDIVIYGATVNGVALCCDSTQVSPLDRSGQPIPRASAQDGAALERAEQRKCRRYPELVKSSLGDLLV